MVTKNFIKKEANPSTLGMYCGGKNQEQRLQWSSKSVMEKHVKCDKATLQTRRVWRKKDLMEASWKQWWPVTTNGKSFGEPINLGGNNQRKIQWYDLWDFGKEWRYDRRIWNLNLKGKNYSYWGRGTGLWLLNFGSPEPKAHNQPITEATVQNTWLSLVVKWGRAIFSTNQHQQGCLKDSVLGKMPIGWLFKNRLNFWLETLGWGWNLTVLCNLS